MGKIINLDDINTIETYDKKNMLQCVHNFPEQCQEAYLMSKKINISAISPDGIQNVVILGMGGSSMAGDLLASLLAEELTVPVIINREYDIPGFINKNTLVIAVSYSGNTEETLSAFNLALRKGARIVALSSGGALKELCINNNIPLVELPPGFMPRAALAYLFFPILEILVQLKISPPKNKEVESIFNLLNFLQKSWKFEIPSSQNQAKMIAQRFFNKIPVIYTNTDYLSKVALRWKNQINENGKSLAHINTMPEFMHNEIVSFTQILPVYHNISIVFLTDTDNKNIAPRLIAAKHIIQNYLPIYEIKPFGGTMFEKMFSLIYMGDFASVYLAFLYEQDPTPITLIDRIKEKK